MGINKTQGLKSGFFSRAIVFAVTMFFVFTAMGANAADKVVTQETLLDRVQIEDMIVKYYVDMSAGKNHDLTLYYTEDAVLDVNGLISTGRDAIEKLYAGLDLGGGEATASKGIMHMLLNNAIVNVDGNNATIWVVWTGFINEDIKGAPKILEQGTEFDELIKVKGQWFIKKRYITAESGLSTGDWPNYKPRSFR
ncbi:MAG: nuclear transport factor 2 family protein [Deltaproteobacteria bacterium]|nr:nuclear transport factor 2 family protein [Deltaproteobacteria bacterium]